MRVYDYSLSNNPIIVKLDKENKALGHKIYELENEYKKTVKEKAELLDEKEELLNIINSRNILKLIAKIPCKEETIKEIFDSYKKLFPILCDSYCTKKENCFLEDIWNSYDEFLILEKFIEDSAKIEKNILKRFIEKEFNLDKINNYKIYKINNRLKEKGYYFVLGCVNSSCQMSRKIECRNFSICNKKKVGVVCYG